METKDIIYELRAKKGLSQEELAEKIFVTRQAVSARLGHCNIRITADTYGHIFDAYQARIAQSVEDKLL